MSDHPVSGISLHLFDDASSAPPRDEAVWQSGMSLDDFIAQVTIHLELWQTTRRLAHISEAQTARAAALRGPLSLLVLTEDWCGDAIHTLPFVARLVEANPAITMRLVKRDEHDAIMATHLSGVSRSIPVVIAYDAAGRERGWWGPRPSPLQAWVKAEGLALEKTERYKRIRTWFARDRGVTTTDEVLALLTHADR